MKSLINGDGSERHWQAVAQYLITCGKIRANIRLQQIQNGTIAESRSVDMRVCVARVVYMLHTELYTPGNCAWLSRNPSRDVVYQVCVYRVR